MNNTPPVQIQSQGTQASWSLRGLTGAGRVQALHRHAHRSWWLGKRGGEELEASLEGVPEPSLQGWLGVGQKKRGRGHPKQKKGMGVTGSLFKEVLASSRWL